MKPPVLYHSAIYKMLSFTIITLALCLQGVSCLAQADFSLSDVPPIKNKRSITMVVEKGFWTEHLEKVMLPLFMKHTGITVTLKPVTLNEMYNVQMQSLKQGNGEFDLLSIEAGWAKEWAVNGYTTPLLDLANEFDSKGKSGLLNYLKPYYPSLLKILSYKGQYHSIPYNTYVMGNHYRADLFEHPLEQSTFAQQYRYPLAPPKNIKQLIDIAKFFTRKAGDNLAGEKTGI